MSTRTLTPVASVQPCAADPDRQFPAQGDWRGSGLARQVCHPCPIRAECLRAALKRNEPEGVWGGFNRPERERLLKGVRARICPGCGMWYVPASKSAKRCHGCPAPTKRPRRAVSPPPRGRCSETGRQRVDSLREQVAGLVTAGRGDREVADTLGVEPADVRAARKRWGLPGGGLAARAARLASDEVRPDVLDAADAGKVSFRELTGGEQRELWRRHVESGVGAQVFLRRYRVSGSTVHKLRQASPDVAA